MANNHDCTTELATLQMSLQNAYSVVIEDLKSTTKDIQEDKAKLKNEKEECDENLLRLTNEFNQATQGATEAPPFISELKTSKDQKKIVEILDKYTTLGVDLGEWVLLATKSNTDEDTVFVLVATIDNDKSTTWGADDTRKSIKQDITLEFFQDKENENDFPNDLGASERITITTVKNPNLSTSSFQFESEEKKAAFKLLKIEFHEQLEGLQERIVPFIEELKEVISSTSSIKVMAPSPRLGLGTQYLASEAEIEVYVRECEERLERTKKEDDENCLKMLQDQEDELRAGQKQPVLGLARNDECEDNVMSMMKELDVEKAKNKECRSKLSLSKMKLEFVQERCKALQTISEKDKEINEKYSEKLPPVLEVNEQGSEGQSKEWSEYTEGTEELIEKCKKVKEENSRVKEELEIQREECDETLEKLGDINTQKNRDVSDCLREGERILNTSKKKDTLIAKLKEKIKLLEADLKAKAKLTPAPPPPSVINTVSVVSHRGFLGTRLNKELVTDLSAYASLANLPSSYF